MKALKFIFVGLLVLFLLLVLWPSQFDAVAWAPGPIPEPTGTYEKNNLLDKMEKAWEGQCNACEDLALDSSGVIYTGTEDGEIVVFSGTQRTILTNTGGRPLGMELNAAGLLIVADAYRGLLSVDPNGQIDVLSTGHNGVPYMLTDDVDVSPDGMYYFTDASSKYRVEQSTIDLMEHGGHGRFLSYDPTSGITNELIGGLQFANGVAVSEDGAFALINETGSYCVRKYWIKGEKSGTHEIILNDLPGYPDNISRGDNGIFWLTLIAPRVPVAEKLMPKRWLRNLVMKLPASISQPSPELYAMILGINGEGEVVYNFQDEKPNLLMITSVEQIGHSLYFGSLVDNGIGIMDLR